MVLLDGKSYRDQRIREFEEFVKRGNVDIRLDIILVGHSYARGMYTKSLANAGVKAKIYNLDENATTDEVIDLIKALNEEPSSTGIILQSPIPKHIDYEACVEAIDPDKDIDGATSVNSIALYRNRENLLPGTVKGILSLLEKYEIDVSGKNVVIVGRGGVGKPLALALLNRDATVTVCHSKTKDLAEITRGADILISATGKPDLIKADMVKDGFIGIDVGIVKKDGKTVGDFAFDEIKDKASFITPVPGGVGPMTVVSILDNLIIAKNKQLGVKDDKDNSGDGKQLRNRPKR